MEHVLTMAMQFEIRTFPIYASSYYTVLPLVLLQENSSMRHCYYSQQLQMRLPLFVPDLQLPSPLQLMKIHPGIKTLWMAQHGFSPRNLYLELKQYLFCLAWVWRLLDIQMSCFQKNFFLSVNVNNFPFFLFQIY